MAMILNMLVYVIILFLGRDVIHLQFVVSFDFMFFIFDFVLVLLFLVIALLPDKHYKILESKKFNVISVVILMIFAIIIFWQHWDVAKDMVIFNRMIQGFVS